MKRGIAYIVPAAVLAWVSLGLDPGSGARRAAPEPVPHPVIVPSPAIAPDAAAEGPDELPIFRLHLNPEAHEARVRVELEAARPTTAHLLFPAEWGGYPGLLARINRIEAWGPGGSLEVRAALEGFSSGHRVVPIERSGSVTFGYDVVFGPPAESRLYHRVSQLAPSGGHLLGSDIFPRIWLGNPTSEPQPGVIQLRGLPPGWRVATVAERSGTGYRLDDVRNTLFVVGPLRTRTVRIGPRSLQIALLGEWSNPDDRLIDAVERIGGALHGMAGDAWGPGEYLYATGRVPPDVPGRSVGGQVVGPSAIVYLGGDPQPEVEFDRWISTTAHELMHWYIPQAFGFEENPPAWFSEGFTDYFALKAALAGDLIRGEEFLAEIGERMARYQASPLFGRASMADAQQDFWEDDAYRYIYDGGALAALLLDLGFQARGRSLEGALERARSDGRSSIEALTSALGGVPENGWLQDWLADARDPEWDRQLERYGLLWRDDRLESTDGWALEVLANVRR